MIKKYMLLLALVLLQFSCRTPENFKPLDEVYVGNIKLERANKDSGFINDLRSPLNMDSTVKKGPLKYYEPTTEFIFNSKLYKNDKQDTITIFGTRGDARKAIVEGYVILNYKGKDYKLNVYKSFGQKGQEYFSIWFTDKTTGKETYHVGRYLDFELNTDPEFVYEIDFNRAFNPYCAYSDLYTCAIPTKDDYLDFEIKAGEKNYHTEHNMETK